MTMFNSLLSYIINCMCRVDQNVLEWVSTECQKKSQSKYVVVQLFKKLNKVQIIKLN